MAFVDHARDRRPDLFFRTVPDGRGVGRSGRPGCRECDLPKLVLLPGDGKHHRLEGDWRVDYDGRTYVVPDGCVTDGASIPSFLRPICGDPNKSPRVYAALVHDWLYRRGGGDEERRVADGLYRDLQLRYGIPRYKAWIEYLALRLCGRSHWSKKRKETDK